MSKIIGIDLGTKTNRYRKLGRKQNHTFCGCFY